MNKTNDQLIILFDGVCNFCNGAVRFVIRHDSKNHFKFAPLQSEVARELLSAHPGYPEKTDSIVLLKGEKIYTKSGAALRISRHLNGLWKLLVVFLIVPPFIRDGVYDLIARKRYKWFGKREECMVPTEELRNRFLD